MGVATHVTHQMTVDDFLAFTDSRPDDEKWELIDGEPVLNASSSYPHQRIVSNLLFMLGTIRRSRRTAWAAIPGIGVQLSEWNLPVPDVLVRPADRSKSRVCDDVIILFEVLSPSTADRDLRWKRRGYASLASLAHYVVVAQDRAELVAYDRATGFAERQLEGLNAILSLPAIDVTLPLADIYDGIDFE